MVRSEMKRTLAACLLLTSVFSALAEEPPMSVRLIGHNEHRTNLPGGRHTIVSTNRATVVKADGTERRSIMSTR